MNITPGKWKVAPAIGQEGMWEIRPEGPFKGNICYVFHTATLSPAIPFAEAEANARAIAMLPELVKALEEIVWQSNHLDECNEIAKATLSKLKGQP